MKRESKAFLWISIIVLIGAFAIIQYYIWGDAFITEFQSDCTDTLLWAQSTLESGKLFKPSFGYAYRLAFGGQWLFIPFLKLFGLGMKALRAGMCLFSVLFASVLFFFFRSLGHKSCCTILETAVMLLAMCATKKTREIFYGHIIHYSLSVIYLLAAFICLKGFLSALTRGKRSLYSLFLLIILFMCSANGTVQMLFVTLPILAGCVIEFFLHRNIRVIYGIFIIVAAAAGGFIFSYSLNTHYSDSYSVIVPAENWIENFNNFPLRWISLFYQLPGKNLDAFSAQWLKTVFKTIIAIVMLAGLFLSFSRYRLTSVYIERIFLFTAWAMFLAFLYFFVFGKISDVDWRLTPLVFACEIVVLILFQQVSAVHQDQRLSDGLTMICGLLLIVHSFSNGLSVLRIPYDKKIWYSEDGLLETLKAHDLDYGFITSYWLSNTITVLSDDTIRSRSISYDWENGVLYLDLFNSDLEWYNSQPGRNRYFLALRESELSPKLLPILGTYEEVYTCVQEDTRNMRTDTYIIIVLDHNIMQDEYDNLLPRYQ